LDGTCIRDYIHVVDLAKGHVAAINKMRPGVSIYNLGSGKGTSVLEMIAAFENASGRKLPHKMVDRRAGDLPEMYADPAKAYKELGWKTELTVEDAMRDTIAYLNNL
jgi:UDP-glucose 4-epimerase